MNLFYVFVLLLSDRLFVVSKYEIVANLHIIF